MDLDALREALGRVPRYALMLLRTDSPIVAAARAVLDSEEAWICREPGSSVVYDGNEQQCGFRGFNVGHKELCGPYLLVRRGA